MQKPDYSMSIIVVKPNDTVPAALLQKLLSENRSAIGFAVRDGVTIDVEKFTDIDSTEEEFKVWQGVLEKTKAHHRTLCLSAFPEKFNAFEVQPWVILKNSKNQPLLLLACEGDFHKYTSKDQSEFFTLVNGHLGPKIEKLYSLLGNDMKKLTDFLRSGEFKADLDLMYGARGVFEFMPAEGEPFTHGKNDIGGEFTWGRASNIYGYTEVVQEAGTAELAPADKPKRSKYADDEPAKEPVAQPPKADPPTTPIEKVAAALPKKRRIDIPRNIHGKRKRAFVRAALGSLPDNWDSLTYLEVDVETTVNSLADLDKTGVKDMVGAKPELKSNVAENMPVPVISGAEQAAVTAFIKKYLDGNSNRVENPLEIQKIEAKLPVFTEVAGQTEGLDFFDGVRTDILKNLVEERPQSAWLLILEYRADRRKRKQMQALGDKKLGELTGTEVEDPTKKSGTSPAPVSPGPGTGAPPEVPVAQPEIKKSRYA